MTGTGSVVESGSGPSRGVSTGRVGVGVDRAVVVKSELGSGDYCGVGAGTGSVVKSGPGPSQV